uniref:Uncharacterized protein n=1 Tax=Rhizophagus irregularis (strain DAOM 181602 / DAOM 197198 / MUCL 43194) TaxID=747089 RepID=U9UJS8_RHIID
MRKREYKDATELEDDDDETTDDRLRTNTSTEPRTRMKTNLWLKTNSFRPLPIDYLAPELDVNTRWNSIFTCWKSGKEWSLL